MTPTGATDSLFVDFNPVFYSVAIGTANVTLSGRLREGGASPRRGCLPRRTTGGSFFRPFAAARALAGMAPLRESRLSTLLSLVTLTSALAACDGLGADDHGAAAAAAPSSPSFVASPSCARPPAVFSRGAYPANIEDVAVAEYGLVGQIAQVHADIPACETNSPATDHNTFHVDQIAWQSGENGFVAPSVISTTGLPADAAGKTMLVYGTAGTFGSAPGQGCTAAEPFAALDLMQYPKAASDMARLRTFIADRATYDDLRAAVFVVDATVTALGHPVYSTASDNQAVTYTFVLVTLQTNAVVCGAAGATFQAWNVQTYGSGDAPALGTRAIFVLGSDPSVDGGRVIRGSLPTTDAARVSALLSTSPALSL